MARDGSARPTKGRLVGFEEADAAPAPLLLPRRGRVTSPAPDPPSEPARIAVTTNPDAEPKPTGTPGVIFTEPNVEDDTSQDVRQNDGRDVDEGFDQARQQIPGNQQPTKGKPPVNPDAARSSNVHIPVTLLAPINTYCKSMSITRGDLMVEAIEYAHPRLGDLFPAAPPRGGTLFEPRSSRPPREDHGPLTVVNYGWRERDFIVLDNLVAQFGAGSRARLLTAVLKLFFTDGPGANVLPADAPAP